MDIETVFSQNSFPVVYKPCNGKLQVKIPYPYNIYAWVCSLLPTKQRSWRRPPPPRGLEWEPSHKVWLIPRSRFEHVTKQLLDKFNGVILLQCHREKQTCAPACWNARGLECECSCMGANHGTGQPDGRWYILGDAYAVQWEDEKLSCQILIKE
jgi:hypothetical protein